jgi:hypothetical protein
MDKTFWQKGHALWPLAYLEAKETNHLHEDEGSQEKEMSPCIL